MAKVYVTDYEYASLDEEKEELEKYGIELIAKQCKTEDDIVRECKDADGLLDQYAPIGRKVIEALPNLKVVARYGVGFNTVDLAAATEYGVCVINVPDYCQDEVSNQAFALMMACMRKITVLNDQVQSGKWDYKVAKPIHRMMGQTLGLLGFGRIPKVLAKKAAAFGLNLVAYDPFLKQEDVKGYNVTLMSLEEVLKTSDIISLHMPLFKETEKIIDAKAFDLMKSTAIIINTSRGPLIDEDALYDAIKYGKIAGAGLDVTSIEPLPADSKLRGLKNVIITPHAAWYSEEAEKELKTKAAHGAGEIISGYDMPTIVNPAVREKLSLKKR
ncbi:C-terminal binding protein [uncultured Dialister sp.]|uniref:C-terminal binding protein n=1 Tax=uncultured Dialister sp. TaxID=278064 RepID=UPI0026DD7A68|nr:C-terminal binding protein [uncultured Dialister sp.]